MLTCSSFEYTNEMGVLRIRPGSSTKRNSLARASGINAALTISVCCRIERAMNWADGISDFSKKSMA
jgi:hypothetical protein